MSGTGERKAPRLEGRVDHRGVRGLRLTLVATGRRAGGDEAGGAEEAGSSAWKETAARGRGSRGVAVLGFAASSGSHVRSSGFAW
jgi:hypothetical protein